jgi:hypothetical protein
LEDAQAFDIIRASGARCPSPEFIVAIITALTARRADFRAILDAILERTPAAVQAGIFVGVFQ